MVRFAPSLAQPLGPSVAPEGIASRTSPSPLAGLLRDRAAPRAPLSSELAGVPAGRPMNGGHFASEFGGLETDRPTTGGPFFFELGGRGMHRPSNNGPFLVELVGLATDQPTTGGSFPTLVREAMPEYGEGRTAGRPRGLKVTPTAEGGERDADLSLIHI